MAVDLHIHSTASDGTETPEAVVVGATQRGLTTIALADHDTVAGVAPAIAVARRLAGAPSVIPAVELSAEQRGHSHELHIVGYFVDVTHSGLLERLGAVRAARETRAREMVRKLQNLGIRITWDAVAANIPDAASIGRPHVAAALVKVGACRNAQEAFAMYLRRDRPAFVQRYKLSVEEALLTIRDAGGIAILAHPAFVFNDGLVRYIIGLGIEGLEAYHVDHTASDIARFIALAGEQGLLVTGGSDSHGPQGPKPVLIGQVDVPDECAERLIARARETGRLRGYMREETV